MKTNFSLLFSVIVVLFLSTALYAGTSFGQPDLNDDNEVLFSVTHDQSGEIPYAALMMQNLNNTKFPKVLTTFPEKLETLMEGSVLQIRNRYGTTHYFVEEQMLRQVGGNRALPQNPMRLGPVAVSPDGKWICFVQKKTAASGSLIIRSATDPNGKLDVTLVENIGYSFSEVPVLWSPASDAIVYENNGAVYFIRVTDVERQAILPDVYRKIGDGLISSVYWASERNLVYINKDIIFNIPANSLYLRAVYSDFLGASSIAGRLTTTFNPVRDRFWVDPAVSTIVLMQAKRQITCFGLAANPSFTSTLAFNPSGLVPRTIRNAAVFWDSNKVPLVWVESIQNGKQQHLLYMVTDGKFVQQKLSEDFRTPALSPDGTRIAFLSDSAIELYDIATKTFFASLGGDKPVSLAWRNATEIFVGGMNFIRIWNVDPVALSLGKSTPRTANTAATRPAATPAATGTAGEGSPRAAPARPAEGSRPASARPAESSQPAPARPAEGSRAAPARPAESSQSAPARPAENTTVTQSDDVEIILLSAAGSYSWDNVTNDIITKIDNKYFLYDRDTQVWAPPPDYLPATRRDAVVTNGYYRVFLGNTPNRNFENALYVRSLSQTAVTRPVFVEAASKKLIRGKIALVFDALDDASGLQDILCALDSYKIRATFFVNGEFLRRYPDEVKTIIQAGHECASMFYSSADLTNINYGVDSEFIKRGLARNEDEFFTVTGKELSLQWHTPLYRSTSLIRTAGTAAGYTWIDKGLAPPDRLTIEEASIKNLAYLSAAEMIDSLERKFSNGAVIPVSVGVAIGSRNDYLYEKLDLLINAILDAGYDIVTAENL